MENRLLRENIPRIAHKRSCGNIVVIPVAEKLESMAMVQERFDAQNGHQGKFPSHPEACNGSRIHCFTGMGSWRNYSVTQWGR